MSAVAIIPARGGSKRIPGKNIRPFCGRPMLGWPVMAARESGVFRDVLVSTDSGTIADVARAQGASVPSLRSPDLSDDLAPVSRVIASVIERQKLADDVVALIYATAAGLRADDLCQAIDKLNADPHADFVLSVCSFAHPPQRRLSVTDGTVRMQDPERAFVRTQDLEPLFHDAAQFVIGRREAWSAGKTVWSGRTLAHLMPSSRAVDIDEPCDWILAEKLLDSVLRAECA